MAGAVEIESRVENQDGRVEKEFVPLQSIRQIFDTIR